MAVLPYDLIAIVSGDLFCAPVEENNTSLLIVGNDSFGEVFEDPLETLRFRKDIFQFHSIHKLPFIKGFKYFGEYNTSDHAFKAKTQLTWNNGDEFFKLRCEMSIDAYVDPRVIYLGVEDLDLWQI